MKTVKEVSKDVDMSEHTVRYYADCGLIPSLMRDRNNQRLFNQESINWLIGIRHLKECGMSIKEIKNYVHLSQQGDSTIQERYNMFLNLKNIASKQLEAAKERVHFLENKVNHYELIVNGSITDDTVPNKWSE
ncbi:MerR family transcriptional regulator [Staphylococcus equorum]|uniref:MerR family transcriptional regulator n=1 Tax=Staphylococcus equorum TaxID=246432 RepID=UPI000D1C54CA|nr:MerR family transcriptional regulator [Staphylococcus equorum]PTE82360.1 MerR family transcriptional regulator [Staphylococcus equorum]PTF10928.1 MerR family transcriptional regulator [Staphylococcus equorum]